MRAARERVPARLARDSPTAEPARTGNETPLEITTYGPIGAVRERLRRDLRTWTHTISEYKWILRALGNLPTRPQFPLPRRSENRLRSCVEATHAPRTSRTQPLRLPARWTVGAVPSSVAERIADERARSPRRAMGAAVGAVRSRSGLQAPPGNPAMSTRCRYCNSTAFGPGCSHSPHRKHEHTCDPGRCEYCGSTAYGPGCSFSPNRSHRHGQGAKCRWCGSSALGPGCSFSPTRVHER